MTEATAQLLISRPVAETLESRNRKGLWVYLLCLCGFFLTFFFAASMAHAQISDAQLNVPATLAAETVTPAPGQKVTLAFHFKPKPGWHGYWENPGDAGFGMQLKWTLPNGVSAGQPRYPVPQPLLISGLMNHVFEEEYAVIVDLTLDKALTVGMAIPVRVRGDWLSCTNQICVPEGGDLAIDLVVDAGKIGNEERARFDIWRSALPAPLDRQALYTIDGKRISIAIPYPQTARVDKIWFFPRTENIFRYAAAQSARRTGDWLVVSGEVDRDFDGQVDGLLRFNEAQGLDVRAVPGAVPQGGDTVTMLEQDRLSRRDPGLTFIWILGFSILGGLLLNLMPCVFPILGLKALAIAKAGGDEGDVRRDALAYTAGIILSCLALGGVMLGLRTAGEEIGWAFQLQEPAIVLLLLLLMVAVAANLAGLFEVGSIGAGDHLTHIDGISGSFWTGVLAAVVATPCTGPFMAVAMGAALLLPVEQALLIFAGLGLGLALPFLAIAYIPAWRSRMPKPGLWMNIFRKWMAVPMSLTALALLWLLFRLAGFGGIVIGGTASLLILVSLFELGRKQRRGLPGYYVIAGLLGISIAAFLILQKTEDRNIVSAAVAGSNEFSEERLESLRFEGRPVFVYFTADWCLTCKANEAAAINRDQVAQAFAKAGIVMMVGDYTRRDPAITRFLAKHGRSGVPLYLYYPAGGEARILPQVLTINTLTNLAM